MNKRTSNKIKSELMTNANESNKIFIAM